MIADLREPAKALRGRLLAIDEDTESLLHEAASDMRVIDRLAAHVYAFIEHLARAEELLSDAGPSQRKIAPRVLANGLIVMLEIHGIKVTKGRANSAYKLFLFAADLVGARYDDPLNWIVEAVDNRKRRDGGKTPT